MYFEQNYKRLLSIFKYFKRMYLAAIDFINIFKLRKIYEIKSDIESLDNLRM